MRCWTTTPFSDGVAATWPTRMVLPLVVTIVLTKITCSKGEIRCYCNIPVCVSTSYMCKSAQGVCFSEQFSYSKELSQSRHGCVELLQPTHQRQMCEEQTRTGRVTVGMFPALLCCSEDMCNYVSKVDIKIQVHSKSNGSYVSGSYGDGSYYYTSSSSGHVAVLHQDLWFKAAVIAVPIAGGFILILLILLAVRLLRQDAKHQRHVAELRRQRHFKSHLLLSPQYYGQDANSPTAGNIFSKQYTNLAMSRDSYCSDVATDKHFVYTKQCNNLLSYSSVFPWGKWKPTSKSSAVV